MVTWRCTAAFCLTFFTAGCGDESSETGEPEGGDEVEVRVVDHIRSCGDGCDGKTTLSQLTVEVRSATQRTVELQWTGEAIEGRPPWEFDATSQGLATVELAPGTWTEVSLNEQTQMCGATDEPQELNATFTLVLDGEPIAVEGLHTETPVESDCE